MNPIIQTEYILWFVSELPENNYELFDVPRKGPFISRVDTIQSPSWPKRVEYIGLRCLRYCQVLYT